MYLAGLCSGLTEAVIINPFEVVKVKLQADRHAFKEVCTGKIDTVDCNYSKLHVFNFVVLNSILINDLFIQLKFKVIYFYYSTF